MTYLPTDKIRIFISSTLTECGEERRFARDAITTLNHEPVMFEAAGARPYPPRSVYLRGLESSYIFVGIYKQQYGYIAENMDISGLEDEYRYATSLGIPKLLYAKRDCSRDDQFEKLVSEMKGPEITVGSYDAPSELYEKLREDINALIAEYFLTGIRWKALCPTTPGKIAEQLAPAEKRVQRPKVEAALLAELDKASLIVVRGAIGAGKTVLLDAMAEQCGWVFVQCGERMPRELLADAANGLRRKLGLREAPYAHTDHAASAFREAWQALPSTTLVLDDVRNKEIATILAGNAELSSQKRIIISTREPFDLDGAFSFSLPLFGREEIGEFVSKNRSQPLIQGELDNLVRLAAGNPLYLRYYATGQPGHFESSLKEYEFTLWKALKPRSREALSYIAISPRSLQLEHLVELMSSEAGSAEEIVENLSEAKSLISESASGYTIFHPHLKDTIKELIKESLQLTFFYTKRLARWYGTKRDYSSAFTVCDDAGVDIPKGLLELAGRHAAVQGDVSTSVKILQRQVDAARKVGDLGLIKNLLVSLAQSLCFAGKIEDALTTLEEAETLRAPQDSFVPVKEVRLSILSWARGDMRAISELDALKNKYTEQGDDLDAARVALDLSASYIRRCDYREAAAEAEFARSVFESHKDAYGSKIAKINLLSALSALPGNQEAVCKLMAEFESDTETSPRQRAALCNILTRKARESGDIEGAKAYANEAIEIGRRLGDIAVICINQTCLGNAFKQEGNLDSALEQYELADKMASEAGLVQLEAWAQRLIASVLNIKGEAQLAIQHARYSIGLVKEGVSWLSEAEAYEELAEGCEIIKDWIGAREAWLRVAEVKYRRLGEHEEWAYGFLRAARLFQKDNAREAYAEAYHNLFKEQFIQGDSELSPTETLIQDMPSLLNLLPEKFVFEVSVYHGRLIFDGVPREPARQIYIRLFRMLVEPIGKYEDAKKYLHAALAVSMAVPVESLSVSDLAMLGKYLGEQLPILSFRAHHDYAAHWVLKTRISKPVIISITQLDDQAYVSLVSICLVLVFLGFSEEVSDKVLAGVTPPRSEANIQIVDFNEAKSLIPLEKVGLDRMEETCVVTRAVNPKNDAGCPIVVITRQDITSDWVVGGGRANSGQMLFAKTLVEFVYHLFAGEIELESLYPKIIALVKRTVV